MNRRILGEILPTFHFDGKRIVNCFSTFGSALIDTCRIFQNSQNEKLYFTIKFVRAIFRKYVSVPGPGGRNVLEMW